MLPVDRESHEETASADLVVRFGTFADRGAHEHRLIPETVRPVCSPAFAHAHGLDGVLSMEGPAQLQLLHMDDRDPRWLDWPRWCEFAGVSPPSRPARFHYRNYPLLLNAAVEGRGVALGWQGLVEPLIDEGTLVGLEPVVRRAERGYLLGARDEENAAIAPIVDWFLRECADNA